MNRLEKIFKESFLNTSYGRITSIDLGPLEQKEFKIIESISYGISLEMKKGNIEAVESTDLIEQILNRYKKEDEKCKDMIVTAFALTLALNELILVTTIEERSGVTSKPHLISKGLWREGLEPSFSPLVVNTL